MKEPSSRRGVFVEPDIFITIDFDGTITASDITDAIIKEFARPGWEEAERLWDAGQIGSKECLSIQMSLIDQPLERLIEYASSFKIDSHFIDFIGFLRRRHIEFAVISDGFKCIIDTILKQADLNGIPVHANGLLNACGGLKTVFENSNEGCRNGTCKCRIADMLAGGRSIVHIGDGRSDFCLAGKASYVFAKGKLANYCKAADMAYMEFADFSEIRGRLEVFLKQSDVFGGVSNKNENEGIESFYEI